MIAPTSVVKITAKEALKGNYLKAVIAALPVLFAVLINTYSMSVIGEFTNGYIASALGFLFSLFLTFPLFTGTVRFFRRLVFGADDNPVGVFHYFACPKQFFRVVLLELSILIRVIAPVLLVTLPVIAVKVLQSGKLYEQLGMEMPDFVSSLGFVETFLVLGAAVSIFFILLRYYLSVFLLVSDDNMSVSEVVHMSRTIGRRTEGDFLVLVFSFAHFILATLLLILAPLTIPYMLAAYCVQCRFAVTHYNLSVRQLKEESTPTYAEGD